MSDQDLADICLMLENGIAQLRGQLSNQEASRCLLIMAEIAKRGSVILSQQQE